MVGLEDSWVLSRTSRVSREIARFYLTSITYGLVNKFRYGLLLLFGTNNLHA